MPQRALVDGREVCAFDLSEQDAVWVRRVRARDPELVIDDDGCLLFLRTPRQAVWHFAHLAGQEHVCAAGYESADHVRLKALVHRTALEAGAASRVESRGLDGVWIADVLTQGPDEASPIAWEVQLSSQPVAATLERTQRYADDGISTVWLAGAGMGTATGAWWVPVPGRGASEQEQQRVRYVVQAVLQGGWSRLVASRPVMVKVCGQCGSRVECIRRLTDPVLFECRCGGMLSPEIALVCVLEDGSEFEVPSSNLVEVIERGPVPAGPALKRLADQARTRQREHEERQRRLRERQRRERELREQERRERELRQRMAVSRGVDRMQMPAPAPVPVPVPAPRKKQPAAVPPSPVVLEQRWPFGETLQSRAIRRGWAAMGLGRGIRCIMGPVRLDGAKVMVVGSGQDPAELLPPGSAAWNLLEIVVVLGPGQYREAGGYRVVRVESEDEAAADAVLDDLAARFGWMV